MRFGYDSVAFKFGRCPGQDEAGGVGGVVASLYAQHSRVNLFVDDTELHASSTCQTLCANAFSQCEVSCTASSVVN